MEMFKAIVVMILRKSAKPYAGKTEKCRLTEAVLRDGSAMASANGHPSKHRHENNFQVSPLTALQVAGSKLKL